MVLDKTTEAHEPVTVEVNSPFRVVHPDTGEAHTDGDEITVPQPLAEQ